MQITQRNIQILKIIVDEYLLTGEVLGSKALLKKYNIGVSPATIRGDMMKLEKLELIYQPYHSAGRLPTAKGLRAFVNYLMKESADYILSKKNIDIGNNIKELSDFVHNILFNLSYSTQEISFFIIPDRSIFLYNGVSYFVEKNIKNDIKDITNILKILEDKISFTNFILQLNISSGVSVFIGEENISSILSDYTIILRPVVIDENIGYIGIIGGLKMNYSFNISALRGII